MSKSVCWILKIDENLFWLQFTICERFVRAVFVFFSLLNKYSCASHMLLLSADHDLHSRCSHILRPNWAKWLRASVSLLPLLVRLFRHSPLSLRFGRKLWNFHYEFSAEIFLWHRMWRLLFLPHCILLIIARQWNDIITFCRSTETNSSSTEIRSFYLKCKKKPSH